MDRSQRELLEVLVRQYLDRAPAAIANRAWADVHAAGVGELAFSWAGGEQPGQGHYYAVAGQTLLLEYDNSQDDANHIHSVWPDLRHDWAGDVLARHYAEHEHEHADSHRANATSRSRAGTGVGQRPFQYGAVARSASVQQKASELAVWSAVPGGVPPRTQTPAFTRVSSGACSAT